MGAFYMTANRDIRIKELNNPDGSSRICGATTQNGEICKNNSGMRTNHPGRGRCWAHEDTIDAVPINNDTQLKIPALEERMNDFVNDKNILNLSGEIALNRSYLEIFNKYISLVQALDNLQDMPNAESVIAALTEVNINDLTANLTKVSNTIGKLVKAQHDIETARKYVIHINSFYTMMNTIADIVNDEIDDVDSKVAIMQRLRQINLPAPEV